MPRLDGRGDRQAVLVARRLPRRRTAVGPRRQRDPPAGRRARRVRASRAPTVIHSFWIPALGGKMDMIPGRDEPAVAEADQAGTYRGACAEFCGTSHALMAFSAVADGAAGVRRLARAAGRARPAAPPATGARASSCAMAAAPATACRRHRGEGRGRSRPHPCRLARDDRRRHPAATRPTPSPASSPSPTRSSPASKMPAFGMLPPRTHPRHRRLARGPAMSDAHALPGRRGPEGSGRAAARRLGDADRLALLVGGQQHRGRPLVHRDRLRLHAVRRRARRC